MKANIYTVNARLAALENFATEAATETKALRAQLLHAQQALASVQIVARSPIEGRQGIAGNVGVQGPRGADGRHGKDGLDGKDSTIAGPRGRDGTDGRAMTVPTEAELGAAVQVLREKMIRFRAAVQFQREMNGRRKHDGLTVAVANVLNTLEKNSE